MMMDRSTPDVTGEEALRQASARPHSVARSRNGTDVAHRILVVEDDLPLARLVGSGLRSEHFLVDLIHDGEEAAAKLATAKYDLLILDLNLPKIDGFTLLAQVRASESRLPVLVLTGRSRTEDLVMTLDRGADDCLLKPFSLLELLARVRALLRRKQDPVPEAPKLGGLTINREEYRVERNGRRIDLTPREFAILEYLVRHAGRPVSRAALMEEVWNIPFDPSTNIVDVYMKYLRDKVDLQGEEKLIRTIRGVGYVLSAG
jgi:two-component system copper resistance phosphate regulon response regulator CusR